MTRTRTQQRGQGVAFPLLAGIILVVALAVCRTAPTPESVASTPTPTPGLHVGDDGRIHISGQDTIFVATSRAALDDLRKAMRAKDSVGPLLGAGKVAMVANDTRVRVLGTGGAMDLRVLEGPWIDEEVWTEPEWVVR